MRVTYVTSLLQMLEESIKVSLITDSVEKLIYLRSPGAGLTFADSADTPLATP